TLDWVSRLDSQLYPILDTEETNPRILVRLLEDRQSRVVPETQRAQAEVELRLNAVETLQTVLTLLFTGESANQRERLIKQLVELKQRFAILIADYHLLLQMLIALFKNTIELEKTTDNVANQLMSTILPTDPVSVERMIKEHEASKNIVMELFRFNSAQIEQVVDKIKRQEPKQAALLDERKIYDIFSRKEETWEQNWLQRKESMEQHLQRCQFDADLQQLNTQLAELGAQMSRVRGQLGESLSTARANQEAFVTFEKTIELLERRVTTFISTAERLTSAEHMSANHVQQELERLHTRWAGLRSQVAEVKRLIDLSVQYFILLEQVGRDFSTDFCILNETLQAEEWFKEGSRLLVTIARRSTSVKTPEEASILLDEVDRFLKSGEAKQDERIEQIKFIASQLYGDSKIKQITTVFIDSKEMIESFSIVNTELITLTQKLQNDEKERQQKESEILAAAKAEAEAAKQKAVEAEQAKREAEEEAARAAAKAAEEARRAAEAEVARQAALAAEEARRASESDAARRAIEEAENAKRRAEMETARLTAEMELVARRAAEADAARAAAAEEDERRRKRDSESARIALLEAQRAFEEEARRSAALAAEEARRAAEANMERLVAEAAAEARKAAAAEAARSAAQAMEEARRVSEAEAAKMVAEQQRYFAQAEAQRLALQAAEDARKAAEAETMKLAAQAAEEARRAAEAENARRAAEAARIEAEIEAAKKAAEKDAALRAAAEAAAQEELMKAKLQAHREESTQTLPSAFPPKFIESLNSAVITEGSDFAFQCRVTGEPDPNIEWLRNGSSIENNPRYLISRMAEGICKLEITKTLQDDAGRFSCRAINEAGRAEVEATLSVKEPVPTVSPPTFTKTLESARVKEGSSHQLECIVHGYPLPTVQWYKNGVCVDSSPDYTIGFNNGHAVLVLDEVSLEDEATFLCQAYNRLGNCRSEANLIVEPKVRSKAPIFLMPLLASTALVGEKYEIHCEIEASPEPIFSWSKDGLPIDQSKEVKVVRDGDKFKCFLSVPQVIPQDSGVYVISAKNVAGEAVSSCNISVKEILKHAPAPPMELESQVTKPVIKMQLKDADAEEGDQFKLDTIISGDPEPEVIWYHNGSPVKESKYVQLGFKGDRCTLLVKHVTTDDAGEYKVVAINSGGEVSSTCSVQIRGKAAEFFAEPPRIVGFPPKFTVLLSDILVPEGETAKLECEVEGKPTPQIQWLINNNPISATDGVS
ncbi:Hypothetical predicted protein, partial [Cloeon dipterum]